MEQLAPATHVLRPERKEGRPKPLENLLRQVTGAAVRPLCARRNRPGNLIPLVEKYGSDITSRAEDELRQEARDLRLRLYRHGFRRDIVARAFALVREAADRVIGMRHFDCQVYGG